MFGLGATEIAVIAILALMLFPPSELPKIARSIAQVYGRIRRMADDFRRTVMEDSELSEPIREIRSAYYQTRHELRSVETSARREVDKVRNLAKEVASDLDAVSKDGTAAPTSGGVANGSSDAAGTPATPTIAAAIAAHDDGDDDDDADESFARDAEGEDVDPLTLSLLEQERRERERLARTAGDQDAPPPNLRPRKIVAGAAPARASLTPPVSTVARAAGVPKSGRDASDAAALATADTNLTAEGLTAEGLTAEG